MILQLVFFCVVLIQYRTVMPIMTATAFYITVCYA